ncbi:MAG: zinc finger domain-containing protein [Candidatus Acidiferrales bacterium]
MSLKKSQLTPKQVSSVPCPTCGVAAGERCVLHSGAPRSESHVDRKFAAIEAAERKSD